MSIVDGNATTTATPAYHKLRISVLPPDSNDRGDIVESVETLAAKLFIIRADNPDDNEDAPISATTTRSRAKTEELFQFIWIALRQALGSVIGGFS